MALDPVTSLELYSSAVTFADVVHSDVEVAARTLCSLPYACLVYLHSHSLCVATFHVAEW